MGLKIRRYRDTDCGVVSQLFYETVHTVNANDYTEEQLFAWAPNSDSLRSRRIDLCNQDTLIAETDGIIVGFGSIDESGYLDMLFVHRDYQRQGIATALCNELEKGLPIIKTDSSVTAKPFFEGRGYIVIKAQEVERMGVKLKNYEMEKKKQLILTILR